MEPKERELLTGMGSCYEACHDDFEATVGMVSGSRDRTAEDVIATLRTMRQRYGNEPEYLALRRRFPAEFPV